MGFGNENSLRILHASTGLITAAYSRAGGDWRRVHEFLDPEAADGIGFPRSAVRQTFEYQEAVFRQFGWSANVVDRGPPSDFEYRIKLPEAGNGPYYLSVAMFQVGAEQRVARAPESLGDGSLDLDLLQGSAPVELRFDVPGWIRLSW